MKNRSRTSISFWVGMALISFCGLPTTTVQAGVCGDPGGTGIPPFLSAGADPNLMLVLDNSGSMLDPAYIDIDTDGTGADVKTQCFDEGYGPTVVYAGNFEEDSWYLWQSDSDNWESWDSTDNSPDPWVNEWRNNTAYDNDEIVYANGGLYRAVLEGTSSDPNSDDGDNLRDDSGVQWQPVSQAGTVKSIAGSCNAVLDNDDSVTYSSDDLVAYNNSVYICDGSNDWVHLEGGQFIEMNDEADALTYCNGKTGSRYQFTGELCTKVDEILVSRGTPAVDYTVQQAMNVFVARGNFLNWVSSSKFDIQKKILTGGKYVNGQLVSESRGCADSGFVKQVSVVNDSSVRSKLVMKVRGANDDDRVGDLAKGYNSDDTTRIEIIGLNAVGFDQGLCQTVIDKLMTDPNTLSQKDIDDCMSADNEVGASQAALSTSVAACAQLWRKDILYPTVSDVPLLATTIARTKCDALYTDYGYIPSTMSPTDGGYVCYGIYDNDEFPFNGTTDAEGNDVDHTDRVGYLGRCWDTGTDCNLRDEVPLADGGCDRGTDPRCMYCGDSTVYPRCSASDIIYKNEGGYNYKCTNSVKVTGKYQCASEADPADWAIQGLKADGVTECTIGSAAGGHWEPPTFPSSAIDDPEMACIANAMLDFCASFGVSEVIDPSDSASSTDDYYNAPEPLRELEITDAAEPAEARLRISENTARRFLSS